MTSFRTLSAITGYIGVIHLVMTLFKNEDTNHYHLDGITCRPANFQIVSVESKHVSEEKIILLWTAFYRDLYFGLGKFGREPFIERRCEARNCFLTNDGSMLDKRLPLSYTTVTIGVNQLIGRYSGIAPTPISSSFTSAWNHRDTPTCHVRCQNPAR